MMSAKEYTKEIFEQKNASESTLSDIDFDGCVFKSCNFHKTTFESCYFDDCKFYSCDLSLSEISDTIFRGVLFVDCKIIGFPWDECNSPINVNFKNSILDYSSFFGVNLSKRKFEKCTLKEVNFTNANLEKTVFKECDLEKSIFSNTNFKEADLRSAKNYSIDLRANQCKKTKFSLPDAIGLLSGFDIIIE